MGDNDLAIIVTVTAVDRGLVGRVLLSFHHCDRLRILAKCNGAEPFCIVTATYLDWGQAVSNAIKLSSFATATGLDDGVRVKIGTKLGVTKQGGLTDFGNGLDNNRLITAVDAAFGCQ